MTKSRLLSIRAVGLKRPGISSSGFMTFLRKAAFDGFLIRDIAASLEDCLIQGHGGKKASYLTEAALPVEVKLAFFITFRTDPMISLRSALPQSNQTFYVAKIPGHVSYISRSIGRSPGTTPVENTASEGR